MRGQPRGGCVQSLILLDFRTVALCAALVATSEAVLAHDATSQFETSIIESCWSVGDEARVDLCLEKESLDHSGTKAVAEPRVF
jgi:hypothetical protein